MGVKQKTKSLSVRNSELSSSFFQLEVLNGRHIDSENNFNKFADKILESKPNGLFTKAPEIFQLNIGKLCNQSCAHCHVDAGPDKKTENMSKQDLDICLDIIKASNSIHTIDITGGAPEMHPYFRWFVEELSKLGKTIMVRCNLTIILANKSYNDLPAFFAKHKVHVVSSLPYFSKSRTDSQRGDGVFQDSILALQMLNKVGYGIEDSGLSLDLVYNPSGAFLPSAQSVLENEFKRQLKRKYDITFNSLFAITNLPISRFLDYLIESGNYESYMEKLIEAYNPQTLDGLMCLNTLSISWDGYIYDCDFNQMLDLKISRSEYNHISKYQESQLSDRAVVINQHCYGCTAGAGSSCGGEVTG
jgi:radical SAM/Cys-rich protein